MGETECRNRRRSLGMRLDHFDDSSLGVGPRVQRSSEQGADKLVGLAYPFKVDLFLTSRFDPP